MTFQYILTLSCQHSLTHHIFSWRLIVPQTPPPAPHGKRRTLTPVMETVPVVPQFLTNPEMLIQPLVFEAQHWYLLRLPVAYKTSC